LLEPRLDLPRPEEVARRLCALHLSGDTRADIDLSMFFSPKTESQVVRLREYLQGRKAAGREDRADRWIRMVATTRLTGHSLGFFSAYTLPPNQATTPAGQRRINATRGQTPPDRDVAALILKKSMSLLRAVTEDERGALATAYEPEQLLCGDASQAAAACDGSVALVVTSPPFLDVVQYEHDNWLRSWFNSLDAADTGRRLTMSRSVGAWSEVMFQTLRELRRVLRPAGWVAFEVGEVRRRSVRLDEVVAPLGVRAGLECVGILVNAQRFTETSRCWGVANSAGGTNTNRVVLFRKA